MVRRYLTHARLALGIVLGLGTFSGQRAAGQSATTPGPGWSAAGTISGGCATSGTCGSSTSSPITGWFEYKPDAVRLETDEQPGPTWDGQGSPARQQCWVSDTGGTYLLGWSAGIWHHAAYWSRVNGVWYGPSNWNWGFEHRDTCQREPTPTVVPTATPQPPAPGVLVVDVRRCTADGPPHTTDIDVTADGQRQTARGVATAAFSVPQGSPVTAYAWGWDAWSDARGSGTAGDRVVLIVTGSACHTAPAPPQPTAPLTTPTPTQLPACRVPLPDDGSAVPMTIAGPGADVAVQRYADHEGTEWTPPAAWPPQGTITAGAPLAITYDFDGLAAPFEPDHHGEVAHLRFGLTDLTTGTPVVDVDTEDIKELTNYDGTVLIWGRTLQARTVKIAPGITFSGATVWYGLNRIHSQPDHVIWTLGQAAPAGGRYFRTPGPVTLTFTPEPGHRYAAWTMAHRLGTACAGTHTRWVLALFAAADVPAPTPCAGVCPPPVIVPGATPPPGPAATPTPLPTPTPPPPPPLPVPAGTLGLWLHAPHDPAQGVYRTGTAMPLVPQGEVIELSAAVELAALPEPPVDPYWGTLYRYAQQVQTWSLVSSDAQLVGGDGCRGAGTVAEGLPGCAYSFHSMPTADDMATQARIIWSAGHVPEQAADVWAYQLDRFRPTNVTIAVAVEVTVIDTRTNTVVRRAVTPLTATVPIGLVAPRTVR